MRLLCSAQRKVELRRLGNQLPVLGKANALCDVGNISLQLTNRDINDSETVYFVIQNHHFFRVMYIFCKIVCVLPVVLHGVPPGGEKNTNSLFLRFFVRSVPLFRWLRLTPMNILHKLVHVPTEHLDSSKEMSKYDPLALPVRRRQKHAYTTMVFPHLNMPFLPNSKFI